MFNEGDKVMRRNCFTNTIYVVTTADVQSKDRVVITNPTYPWWSERVAQNNLRKISRAELSIMNAFSHIIKDVVDGDEAVSPFLDKFTEGDIVMYRYDCGMALYKVKAGNLQTRGRVNVVEIDNPWNTMRVSQNSLRKLSKAELSVIKGYTKLIEDVVRGN